MNGEERRMGRDGVYNFCFLLKVLCTVLGDARQSLGVILASLKCSCFVDFLRSKNTYGSLPQVSAVLWK